MTTGTITSRADVATDAPARYAKQLVSHLGRKLTTETLDAGEHRIAFDGGDCMLVEGSGSLTLEARADDAEVLERIERVVGSHLERFGERAGLVVTWVTPGSSGVSRPPV